MPLTLALVEEGVLSLESVVEKLATAPAKAFSLAAGTLAVGALADVTIVDPHAQWEVDPTRFRSKSRNTPFGGWKVKGRVTVLDSQSELMAAALKYLGYSVNDRDPKHWQEAKNVILKAKPYWAAFKASGYIEQLAAGIRRRLPLADGGLERDRRAGQRRARLVDDDAGDVLET